MGDERLMCGSVSRNLLDRSKQCLHRMVEHHYELQHMYDIERRQIEEIDKLREKYKDSENKVKHLAEIRKALEDTITELRTDLKIHRTNPQIDKQLLNSETNSWIQKKE